MVWTYGLKATVLSIAVCLTKASTRPEPYVGNLNHWQPTTNIDPATDLRLIESLNESQFNTFLSEQTQYQPLHDSSVSALSHFREFIQMPLTSEGRIYKKLTSQLAKDISSLMPSRAQKTALVHLDNLGLFSNDQRPNYMLGKQPTNLMHPTNAFKTLAREWQLLNDYSIQVWRSGFLTAAAGIRACAIERSDLTPSHRWVDHLATVSNGALISDGNGLICHLGRVNSILKFLNIRLLNHANSETIIQVGFSPVDSNTLFSFFSAKEKQITSRDILSGVLLGLPLPEIKRYYDVFTDKRPKSKRTFIQIAQSSSVPRTCTRHDRQVLLTGNPHINPTDNKLYFGKRPMYGFWFYRRAQEDAKLLTTDPLYNKQETECEKLSQLLDTIP